MSNGVWFASETGGQGIWALSESAASLSITDIDPGPTSIVVTWTGGTATHYRINGGTATAMPDGTSPDTITGLTANTEYNSPGLELSADGGSTWSTPVAFGTDNAGSGGWQDTNLAPADAAHAHSADNLTLTTGSALAVADAAHGHAADNITLNIGGITLSIADASHAHTADAQVLTAASVLAVADALHGHAADNLTLVASGAPTLTVAEASHAHAADSLLLTATAALVIADALQAHVADNVVLDFVSSDRVAGALSTRRKRLARDYSPTRRPNTGGPSRVPN